MGCLETFLLLLLIAVVMNSETLTCFVIGAAIIKLIFKGIQKVKEEYHDSRGKRSS